MIAGSASIPEMSELAKFRAAIKYLQNVGTEEPGFESVEDIEIDMAQEIKNLFELSQAASEAGNVDVYYELGIFFISYERDRLSDPALEAFKKVPKASKKYDEAQSIITSSYLGAATEAKCVLKMKQAELLLDLAIIHAIKIQNIALRAAPMQKIAQVMVVTLQEIKDRSVPDNFLPSEFIACVGGDANPEDLRKAFLLFKEMAMLNYQPPQPSPYVTKSPPANELQHVAPLIFSETKRISNNSENVQKIDFRAPSPPKSAENK